MKRIICLLVWISIFGITSKRLESAFITDLGLLPGNVSPSWGNDLAKGVDVASGWAGSPDGVRAFRWDAINGMVSLGTLGGNQSYGNSISADGSIIAGRSQNNNNIFQPFIWDNANGMRMIGSFGGSGSANGISSDGSIVVGQSKNSLRNDKAFRWTSSGGMVDLGTLGGSSAVAVNISADGTTIVGSSLNASGNETAFTWTSAIGMASLGTLGGNVSRADDVSSDGEYVVGYSTKIGGTEPNAFRWSQLTGMVDLGILPGRVSSQALSVSPDGYLVGGLSRASDTNPTAFLWSESNGIDSLYNVLFNEGVILSNWVSFTEIRSITGNAVDGYNLLGTGSINGQAHAFIVSGLFAVPEPSSYVLMGIALGLLACKRRMIKSSEHCQ